MSKPTQLSSVNERRLRLIYEQLDNGNYKKALNESEKVLKKQRSLTAAKVLKTIALHRLGRKEDAFSLSKEVLTEEPTDENSLQGMSLYYKEIRRPDLISPMYEIAVKYCPSNEEYLTHLFMSYVRMDKFREMHRVAVMLYKQHPKNPYLFWGIMSIVLQAQNAEDQALSKKMYLPLAEKMIEKHINDGKIEAEAEVRLYLLVLNLLDKHSKALDVVSGKLGEKLSPVVKGYPTEMLKIQESLKDWPAINVENRKLLRESPDVWNYAIAYMDSLLHIIQNSWVPTEEQQKSDSDIAHFTAQQGMMFAEDLVEQENYSINKRRGPYLLRLELIKRYQENDIKKDDGEDYCLSHKILLQYTALFATKPCCFQDLSSYLDLLSSDEIQLFMSGLETQTSELCMNGHSSENPYLTRMKNLHRNVFAIHASRHLGEHKVLSTVDKLKLASEYMEKYFENTEWVEFSTTDPSPVDKYCIFTVLLLLDAFRETSNLSLLWRCVSVLELCTSNSCCNYEAKFYLVRIYCYLGALKPALKVFESMDIKHVQYDTVGYTIYPHLVTLGQYQLASHVFSMTKSYFLANEKECTECLVTCYRNGTFDKISEIIDYRKVVTNSFQLALTNTEQDLMSLYNQANVDVKASDVLQTIGERTSIPYDKLSDNRDFSMVMEIDCKENKSRQKCLKVPGMDTVTLIKIPIRWTALTV